MVFYWRAAEAATDQAEELKDRARPNSPPANGADSTLQRGHELVRSPPTVASIGIQTKCAHAGEGSAGLVERSLRKGETCGEPFSVSQVSGLSIYLRRLGQSPGMS